MYLIIIIAAFIIAAGLNSIGNGLQEVASSIRAIKWSIDSVFNKETPKSTPEVILNFMESPENKWKEDDENTNNK